MNNSLVSVIIPIYKVEEYLARCLDSVLQQSYTDLEIICVNDGSPDGCLRILKEYAAKDSRVKVVDQANQGVSAARNNGLKEASGDVIAYIDSDDWVHPQYFERLISCMKQHNADVVFCEGVKVYDDKAPEQTLKKDISAKQISLVEAFSLWTARHCVWARVYKREMLNGHEFASEIRIGDDTMFNLDVLCHAKEPSLYSIREALYYWFIRQESITHTAKPGGVIGEAEWYSKHMDTQEVTGSEWLLLEQAIKAALSARYSEMFTSDACKYKEEANGFLKIFISQLWNSKFAPFTKKILLTIMYKFPLLYRTFRRIQDPTMRAWEKSEKKRQAEASRSF